MNINLYFADILFNYQFINEASSCIFSYRFHISSVWQSFYLLLRKVVKVYSSVMFLLKRTCTIIIFVQLAVVV